MFCNSDYLFTSRRLGFRKWEASDLDELAAMNADSQVMQHFPGTYTRAQSMEFITEMQQQFVENGFCYYAVDMLEPRAFAGFIGLSKQVFEADFTPCIDIGWRLKKDVWNRGYATEGARACLDYAFDVLNISTILAMAPKANRKSERIMQNINMKKVKDFIHPRLASDPHLQACVLYAIHRTDCRD